MRIHTALIAILTMVGLVLSGCLDDPPEEEQAGAVTMAEGTTASLPLVMREASRDAASVSLRVVDAQGIDVALPMDLHDAGNDTLSGWVGFTAANGTEKGAHTVRVAVDESGDPVRELVFTVNVEDPPEPIQEGDQAFVHFAARTQDGRLVFTTMQEIAEAPLYRVDDYQPPAQHEAIPLSVVRGGQLPDTVIESLLAVGEGFSVTALLPEFFGPETMEQELPREETVPRASEEQRRFELPRAQAEAQQLIGSDAQVGDSVQVGLPLPYVIEAFQDSEQGELVVIGADVQEDDTLTLHDAWPDAAEVVAMDDDAVHVYETPPYAQGETFTWNPGWTDATEITHLDEEAATLRHSPAEGTTYTQPGQQPGQSVEATVVSVQEDVIVVESANPEPLAGETVLFDMTVVEVTEPEAENGMG